MPIAAYAVPPHQALQSDTLFLTDILSTQEQVILLIRIIYLLAFLNTGKKSVITVSYHRFLRCKYFVKRRQGTVLLNR